MSLDAWIEQIFGNGMFGDVVDIVTFKKIDYRTMSAGINGVYEKVMLPIGLALLTLYFLIELMEKTTHDNFNMEHFIRMFIKLVIGVTLMNNGLTLLDGIRSMGDFITTDILNLSSVGDVGANGVDITALKNEVNNYNWLDKIITRVNLILPYVCSFIVSVAVQVVCWSRAIELLVRTMMAPIAMADIFSEGLRGGGFRYLKKYFATVLQGAIILGIVVVMSSINATLMGINAISSLDHVSVDFFVNTSVVTFASVSLIMKSKEWANDVAGA